MPVAARQVETTIIQHAHDLGHGAELQERLEYKLKPLLNRHVGILDDHTARIAHQADRQVERKLTAFCLRKQAGRQAAADRMQLELRYRPLQTEEQATVGAAGIIDAIPIGDQAAAQPADVQERVPVGTVASEPRHIDRQDQPHLAEPDPTDEFLKTAALRGGRAAQAEIGVDQVDVGLMPSQFVGALAKRVLQPQALLIAYDLVWRRLSDVDNRPARQVGWLDQFGLHEAPPPEPRQRRRQFDAAKPATASPTACLGLYS